VDGDDVIERTARALARSGRHGELGAHVPPGEIDEVRLIGSWLASHPDAPQLALRPEPTPQELRAFLTAPALATSALATPALTAPTATAATTPTVPALAAEGELDDDRFDLVGADTHV
jgi:hypothetical protein